MLRPAWPFFVSILTSPCGAQQQQQQQQSANRGEPAEGQICNAQEFGKKKALHANPVMALLSSTSSNVFRGPRGGSSHLLAARAQIVKRMSRLGQPGVPREGRTYLPFPTRVVLDACCRLQCCFKRCSAAASIILPWWRRRRRGREGREREGKGGPQRRKRGARAQTPPSPLTCVTVRVLPECL